MFNIVPVVKVCNQRSIKQVRAIHEAICVRRVPRRFAKSAVLGFAQVEHLFKTANQDIAPTCLIYI